MNRTYAAKRLLEHGPLTKAEFVEITGWEERQARRVLQQLLDTEVVTYRHQLAQNRKRFCRTQTRVYALAFSTPSESSTPSTLTMQTGHLTDTQGSFHG